MSVSVTYGDRGKNATQFSIPFTLTFDDSYPTGGETITAVNFGLDRFENISISQSKGYTFDAIIAAGGATALIKAYYAEYSTSTDGVLIDVANETDLSAVSVTGVAYGK